MAPTSFFIASVPAERLKVWVLAPSVITSDANIDYYYDFSQSIEEYTRVFAELDLPWQWQPVTMDTFREVIDSIVSEKISGRCVPLVLNLCDGDEINGAPGISVLRYLHQSQLVYTGADEYFYHITTSKIPMKQAFDLAALPTAPWEAILSPDQDITGIFSRLGSPVIVKPAVSGGSMGVGVRNVVYNENELQLQVRNMFDGYRGWNLSSDGIIAEAFIDGPEFTSFISGSAAQPVHCRVYAPVERVFHETLPAHEKFLSFDRLWEIYEDETPMPGDDNFYEYRLAPQQLIPRLQQLSLDAYRSVGGTGYTRIDIRMDAATGQLYVLEVNAQCGLSEDEDFTSIGAILRVSGTSFTTLVTEIINDAFRRHTPSAISLPDNAPAPVVPLASVPAQRKKIR